MFTRTRIRCFAVLSLILLAALLCAACSRKSDAPDAAAAGKPYAISTGMSAEAEAAHADAAMPSPAPPATAESKAAADAADYDAATTRDRREISGEIPVPGQTPLEPRPNILTAGEWNDNAEYNFLLNLIQTNQDWRIFASRWAMDPSRRVEVKATVAGKPAVNAKVELLGANGQSIWTARTDNTGTAYVFAGFDRDGQRVKSAGIRVVYDNQMRQEPWTAGQKTLTVAFPGRENTTTTALDLMFVVDSTGSMQDELDFLKAELVNVIDQVRRHNANIPTRLAVSVYRDHGDDYLVRATPFADDFGKAQRFLNEQNAAGGGDYEEAVELALDDAINQHDWNPAARARLLFLVLDAPPHDTSAIKTKMRELAAQAAAKGIRIIPVASSGVDKDTEFLLRCLALASGGTYVFLTDHSGVGNPHLEPTIGPYDVEKLNSLLVRLIDNYVR